MDLDSVPGGWPGFDERRRTVDLGVPMAAQLHPPLEEGLLGMRIGGVRQIIVPPELGYPASDPSHTQVGPKPLTFSGQRALDFVLQVSGAIDIEIYIG